MDVFGRQWVRDGLSLEALVALDAMAPRKAAPGVRHTASDLGAAGAELARIARHISPSARAVRVVSFDKNDDLNWSLGWHQDRVISLRDRVDLPGYSVWTRKAGVWHVEPPIDFLASMFFLRVHLDDADADNGALEVALGSHLFGRVPSDGAAKMAEGCVRELCTARRGDVLAASALLLHRSGMSRATSRRRAIRIDYATAQLPPQLTWADALDAVPA